MVPPPQSCTFFNTPYLWNRSIQNETDFTKMFLQFWEQRLGAIYAAVNFAHSVVGVSAAYVVNHYYYGN